VVSHVEKAHAGFGSPPELGKPHDLWSGGRTGAFALAGAPSVGLPTCDRSATRLGFSEGPTTLSTKTSHTEPIDLDSLEATRSTDRLGEPVTNADLYLLIFRARERSLEGESFIEALIDEAEANLCS